jgi:hypothetical protein
MTGFRSIGADVRQAGFFLNRRYLLRGESVIVRFIEGIDDYKFRTDTGMAKDTKFKKGHSGNPKGKPKGPRKVAKKRKAVAKPYEQTERERPALEAFEARRKAKPPVPMMKKADSDKNSLKPDHPDLETGSTLLMEALGTTSSDFMCGLVTQLGNAGIKGSEIDVEATNFMLSMVVGIEPKDQIEAMLAAQMAAIHLQTMTFARRINHVENIPQQDSAERAFNKLARTFTTQMEALNKYRGKGQQKMTVEHVHVHEGGQAIVGNVQGGGGENKKEGQPHAKQVTHAPVTPMPGQDEAGDVMPIPGNAQRKVPVARR